MMKKLKWALALLLIPAITSCNSGTTDEAIEGEVGKEQVKEQASEFGDVADLMKKSEYTTAEITRVTRFLAGQEVTITGYPYAYPLGEGEEVEFKPGSTEMIDGIDNTVDNVGVRVKFKNETEPRIMHIGELFAVKGKLDVTYSASEKYGNSTSISITEAEYVDNAEAKGGGFSTVSEIDKSKQLFLGDLYKVMHKHFESLNHKPSITVTGDYYSTTVSKNYEQTEILEIRVDLGGSDDKVGCEMIEEPDGDMLNAKRSAGEKISIVGKFSGITFGNPRINGGVIK